MEQILLTQEDKNVIVKEKTFNNEKEMQEVIKNNPSLINLGSIFNSPLLVIGRENGNIDVLALTAIGVPVIVECKRKSNPDMRYLIAQVFEYASYLDDMSYKEFKKMVEKFFGSDRCQDQEYMGHKYEEILDIFIDKTNYNNIDSDIDITDKTNLQMEIRNNLDNGEFYLVITVDTIDKVTMRTINFLNEKLEKLRIEVIEIKKYEAKNDKIFVPEHINNDSADSSKRTAPGKISFEEMLNEADAVQENIIRKFKRKWLKNEKYSIKMQTKGFSARYKDNSILWIFADRIQINRYFRTKYGEEIYNKLKNLVKNYFNNHVIYFDSENFELSKFEILIENIRNEILINFDKEDLSD